MSAGGQPSPITTGWPPAPISQFQAVGTQHAPKQGPPSLPSRSQPQQAPSPHPGRRTSHNGVEVAQLKQRRQAVGLAAQQAAESGGGGAPHHIWQLAVHQLQWLGGWVGGQWVGGWMGAGWGPMMWLPEWWITSRSPNATPGMCIAGDMGIPARQATSCAWPPTHLHQSSRCVRAGQLLRPGASQPKHVF